MEVIRKKILRAMTTGATTGGTVNDYIIIPDLSKEYHFKISLNQDHNQFGYFYSYDDVYVEGNNTV